MSLKKILLGLAIFVYIGTVFVIFDSLNKNISLNAAEKSGKQKITATKNKEKTAESQINAINLKTKKLFKKINYRLSKLEKSDKNKKRDIEQIKQLLKELKNNSYELNGVIQNLNKNIENNKAQIEEAQKTANAAIKALFITLDQRIKENGKAIEEIKEKSDIAMKSALSAELLSEQAESQSKKAIELLRQHAGKTFLGHIHDKKIADDANNNLK